MEGNEGYPGMELDFEVSASPSSTPKGPPCVSCGMQDGKSGESRRRVSGLRAGTRPSTGQEIPFGVSGLRAGAPESERQVLGAGASGLRAGAPAEQHRQYESEMPEALVVGDWTPGVKTFAQMQGDPSLREQRERENEECRAGLRNAARA
eukprot:2234788-Amphidinium_carterae.1